MERYLIHFVIKRKEAIAYLYEQMFPEPYFDTDYRAKYIFARPLLWTYLYVSMNFTLLCQRLYNFSWHRDRLVPSIYIIN